MPELIDHIPAPVLDDFVRGRWLPVIGAGLSRNAVVKDGSPPALWPDLGSSMAGALGIDTGDSVIEVLSAYGHSFGRQKLVEQVGIRIRAHDAKPGDVHRAFAGIQFTDLVTTNFDTLLETAYERLDKRSFPVVDESLLSAENYFPGPRIIKLHGDLAHPDRMVLTEDDYDSFLTKNPLLVTSVTAMFVDRELRVLPPPQRRIWLQLGEILRENVVPLVGVLHQEVSRLMHRRGTWACGGSSGNLRRGVFRRRQAQPDGGRGAPGLSGPGPGPANVRRELCGKLLTLDPT